MEVHDSFERPMNNRTYAISQRRRYLLPSMCLTKWEIKPSIQKNENIPTSLNLVKTPSELVDDIEEINSMSSQTEEDDLQNVKGDLVEDIDDFSIETNQFMEIHQINDEGVNDKVKEYRSESVDEIEEWTPERQSKREEWLSGLKSRIELRKREIPRLDAYLSRIDSHNIPNHRMITDHIKIPSALYPGDSQDLLWSEHATPQVSKSKNKGTLTFGRQSAVLFLRICDQIGRSELENAPDLDNQLLMMTYIYFVRLRAHRYEWTIATFYLLLYIAIEMEEEGCYDLLDLVFLKYWECFSMTKPTLRLFHRRKNFVWKKMDYRVWVSLEEILNVMKLFPKHWIFTMIRSIRSL